ncbi:MAG TPA: ABC transporter ATP-binding protein [Chloroflexia bacterium]|nr:ABC transporter ATP-binding protein [Chloroflexia bacterium]
MNAVEMTGITKRFAGVVANDNVDFAVRTGEVHALLGENGAGKSTLMSILAGLYRPDAGSISLFGKPASLHSPRDAIAHGIGMVYQHFMLVESLTVAENAMLGQSGRGVGLDTTRVERELDALSKQYNLRVDPRARIWQLSVGEQQRVEILRLLYRGAKILVFDEPTAVLTPQEAMELVKTLRHMAFEQFSIIFISHKLAEVLAVADRVTVLRKGRVVGTVQANESDKASLARLMVGREILDSPRPPAEKGSVVLETRGLTANGDRGLPALEGVDLEVCSGEVLGIAGVAGNGQRELAEVLTGLRPSAGGKVLLGGKDMTGCSPGDMVEAGVAHVPEDRLGTGLISSLDLVDNSILKSYKHAPAARGPFIDGRAAGQFTDGLIREYSVSAPGRTHRAGLLSGGNQQKLLLARELSGDPKLIVAVHPTRGVDIGATELIHRLLLEQRERGAAVLLISEDLDELMALSDRIAVLYEGKIMGVVEARGADIEHLGMMMAGTALSVAGSQP